MIWKRADRLAAALARVAEIRSEIAALRAPHPHELVRLKETEAMVLAAELMLRASLTRTESRLSHFREDCDARDDEDWLAWVDVREERDEPVAHKTPIPTPICSVADAGKKPAARRARRYVAEPVPRP
jgi:succinate dehydrogenase/fumarate reductase flavoprotein subunit